MDSSKDKQLNQDYDMSCEKFDLEKFKKQFPGDCKKLLLHCNYIPTILKQINLNVEVHMIILNLGYNMIQSIEPLGNVAFNSLRELHLFHNRITTIKSLRKTYFPRLVYINIVQNCLTSLQGLQQCNIPCLEQFWAYSNNIFSIYSIIKLNAPNLRGFSIGEIDEKIEVELMMAKKFPKINQNAIQQQIEDQLLQISKECFSNQLSI